MLPLLRPTQIQIQSIFVDSTVRVDAIQSGKIDVIYG